LSRTTIAALALTTILAATGCTTGSGSTPGASVPASPPPAVPSAAAPSTAPTAASGPQIVASGTFHKVGSAANGTVQLKHLTDGSFAVVFEDFEVSSADHTHVILVPTVDVTKDADIDQAKILDLGPLVGTKGMQDYKVPADMAANAMTYHTVVLWDAAMNHALAAAPLKSM
jgi:hypothetical protein